MAGERATEVPRQQFLPQGSEVWALRSVPAFAAAPHACMQTSLVLAKPSGCCGQLALCCPLVSMAIIVPVCVTLQPGSPSSAQIVGTSKMLCASPPTPGHCTGSGGSEPGQEMPSLHSPQEGSGTIVIYHCVSLDGPSQPSDLRSLPRQHARATLSIPVHQQLPNMLLSLGGPPRSETEQTESHVGEP